jgi:hypothetical protein
MKLKHLFVTVLLVFGFVGIANAQSTQNQWLIVTSSESAPNALLLSGCTKNSDKPSSSCYNPLIFLFDLDMPSGSNWTRQAAVLSSDGSNVLSLTNSIGSNDGGVSITVSESSGVYTVTATNEDGSVFVFKATAKADPMSGTFTSSGGSSNDDSGSAAIYNDVVAPNGSYPNGVFDQNYTASGSPSSTQISVTASFGSSPVESNFSLNTVTLTPAHVSGKTDVCWVTTSGASYNTLSTADALAQTYGPSFVTGDMTNLMLGDGKGTVLYVQLTPGTDSDGAFADGSNPDSNSTEYVSYYVVASQQAGCTGAYGNDVPFHRASLVIPKPILPLRFRFRR